VQNDAAVRMHAEHAAEAIARGAHAEAADEFAAAVRLAPDDAALRQRLANHLLWMGRAPQAIEQLQQVVGHLAAQGQLLKAIAICRVILEIEPEHRAAKRMLAELHALQHESVPLLPRLPTTAAATGADTPPPGPVDSEVPLLSLLGQDAFLSLVSRMRVRWMTKGERIVAEGDPGDCMYVVVQGSVVVVREPAGQPRQTLALLSDGSFFGEMALMSGGSRLATVLAAEDGLLLALDRETAKELELRHPDVGDVLRGFYRERLLKNLLAVSPLFRSFSAAEKRRLAARFRLLHAGPGDTIIAQGQEGHSLFVLLRGRCDVSSAAHDGRIASTAVPLREGDLFGEISLLFSSPSTATVRAAEPCELLELPRRDAEELVLPHEAVRRLIERMARERLSLNAALLRDMDEAAPTWWV
jgi:cAMP-dependent protein kinase regulator